MITKPIIPSIGYLVNHYPEAFRKGQAEAVKNNPGNPYTKNTEEWMAWNRGWNSVEGGGE